MTKDNTNEVINDVHSAFMKTVEAMPISTSRLVSQKVAIIISEKTFKMMFHNMLNRLLKTVNNTPILHLLAIYYCIEYFEIIKRSCPDSLEKIGTPAAVYVICFRLAFMQLDDYTLTLKQCYKLPINGTSECTYSIRSYEQFKELEWQIINALDYGRLPDVSVLYSISNIYK